MRSTIRLLLISLAGLASFFLLLFLIAAATGNAEVASWAALVLGFIGIPVLLLYLWRAPVPKEASGDGFGTVRRAPADREGEIARWAGIIAGSSAMVAGLAMVAMYAAVVAWNGGVTELYTAFMLKAAIVAALYVLSLWLLATLGRKSTKRRAISWGYSFVFHVGLPVYLGISEKIGEIVLALCLPELAVSILSLVGLGFLIYGRLRPQRV